MPFSTETAQACIAAPCLILVPEQRGLPLQGITVLVVEDSRFASDAIRLLCQRSGARLRRAESLEQAWSHLRVYRPDVILIDLGLPDGRGEALIRRLAVNGQPRPVLLGISGDPDGKGAALSAGADGFIDKPIGSLAAFQRAVQAHLPGRLAQPSEDSTIAADPAALHDDLARAVHTLGTNPSPEARRYLAGFLGGVALQSSDPALSEASAHLSGPNIVLESVTRLISERLSSCAPFPGGIS